MEDNYKEALRRIEEAKRTEAWGLDLRGLGLEEVPEEVFELIHLRALGLGADKWNKDERNNIRNLSARIGELQNLEILDLPENQLTSIPSEIGQLKNLKELRLMENQLQVLPDSIGQLSTWESLI